MLLSNQMSMEAIDKLLGDLGDISKIATALGEFLQDSIETEVKARFATSGIKGTGALRDSINVEYLPDLQSIRVSMKIYGSFQNWGVVGTKHDPGARDVDDLWYIQPLSGSKYQFKSKTIGPKDSPLPFAVREHIAEYGIRPKPFIPSSTYDRWL